MLPDYIRGVNADHIGPRIATGRVPVPSFSFEPASSQYTQPAIPGPQPMFRAYDVTGSIVEFPLYFIPDDQIDGVPSAGLYQDYEVRI